MGDRAVLATKAGGHLAGFTVGDTVEIVENPHDLDPEHYRVKNAGGTLGYVAKNGGLKAIEPTKPERLKVGEYAKVVGTSGNGPSVKIGDINEIITDDDGVMPFRGKRIGDGNLQWFYEKSLVRATDEEVAAARRYKVGDYVQVTKPGGFHNYKIGEFVQVTEMYGSGSGAFKGLRSSNATIGNWLLPKQVIPATEAQFTMSTPKPTFNVGDTVKLTVAAGKTPRFNWGSVKNGDVGTVRYVRPDKVVVNFPSQSSWNADPTELTKVSAEEAQPKPDPRSQFAKGDKVRLIAKADRLNGYEVGKIYEVSEPLADSDRVAIKGGSVPNGYAKADQLEKVTEADVKAAAAEAKWAKIGRKVGEYKVGDIVRFKKYSGVNGLNEHDGVIVEIDDLGGMNPHLAKPTFVKTGYNTYTHPDHFELVTPVEARFDR
ncbi:hypothetical protein BN871_AT_00400 [Paenibacillus sp. P22]|nr:hypothetical protein BN871_AT_00400 [Paenibacillus sp. P22]